MLLCSWSSSNELWSLYGVTVLPDGLTKSFHLKETEEIGDAAKQIQADLETLFTGSEKKKSAAAKALKARTGGPAKKRRKVEAK